MKKDLLARKVVLEALDSIFQGQRLDFAIEKIPLLSNEDNAFARMLIMTVIRRNGEIDSIIKKFTTKKITKKKVALLLKIGIAQLLFMQTAEHAAINTTVELAKKSGFLPYSGMINGVLRSVQREKDTIKTDPTLNLPKWLKTKIDDDLGYEKTQAIASSILTPPTLYITVKNNPEKWAEELEGKVIYNNTISIPSQKIPEVKGFNEGEWWVQDFSAAIPASLFSFSLKNKKGADFCAAPGGKTAQLLNAGADVTAFDISEKRTEIMRQNFIRLGFNPEIITNDACEYLKKNPIKYDFILLDAPCSAVGTIRKNADILLKKSPSLPLDDQAKLLETAFNSLNPGGEIVYSVCSFFKQEGIKQIDKFLSLHKNAEKIPINLSPEITKDGNLLITPDYLSEHGGVDGFFAAVIRKQD